jgi:TorA maturation chaperone TorD
MVADKSTDSKFTEFRENAQARSNLYKFFSTLLLKEPSAEVINNIQNEDFLKNLPEVFGEDSIKYFEEFINDFENDYKDLEAEYNSLFVVPLRTKYVKPYESVYKTGLTNQKPMCDVIEMYERVGIEISTEYTDFPDHAGLELEFMGVLCDRELKAWEGNKINEANKFLSIQKEFIDQHISTWIPNLCDEINDKTISNLFKGVATLLKKYISLDSEQINEITLRAKKLK